MSTVLSFDEVEAELGADPALLMGNGFSIACDASYSYRALRKNLEGKLPAISVDLMERLGTANVEEVMQILEDAHWVGRRVGNGSADLALALVATRKAMVEAIAADHLRSPKQIDASQKGRSGSAARFLSRFATIFTTNYDLLLYWIVMKNNPKSEGTYPFRDGFRREETHDYGEFNAEVDVNVHYLHGGVAPLHP